MNRVLDLHSLFFTLLQTYGFQSLHNLTNQMRVFKIINQSEVSTHLPHIIQQHWTHIHVTQIILQVLDVRLLESLNKIIIKSILVISDHILQFVGEIQDPDQFRSVDNSSINIVSPDCLCRGVYSNLTLLLGTGPSLVHHQPVDLTGGQSQQSQDQQDPGSNQE